MIIYRVKGWWRTSAELVTFLNQCPAAWVEPFSHVGTMDERCWSMSDRGEAKGGGQLFRRLGELEINQAGRTFSRGGLYLRTWTREGDDGMGGTYKLYALAEYLGYAYHVRSETYLLRMT